MDAELIVLTDSGLETDLIFHQGIDLPSFAAFALLDDAGGRNAIGRYYREHLAVATRHGTGFVLEAPTWRANTDWGRTLGYDQPALDRINEQSIAYLSEVAAHWDGHAVISGCVGPRSDGYAPSSLMSVEQAQAYHQPQVAAFARAGADMVHAMTITYPAEAIGIVVAAMQLRLPVAISFTLETDGRLPDGNALADAVREVDVATGSAAAYFGINCAHPDHIRPALDPGAAWTTRLHALRANASRRSHAELDEAPDLDDGDPVELAAGYRQLRASVPSLRILGGCCGTDVRHVAAIAALLAP